MSEAKNMVKLAVSALGYQPKSVEGYRNANWILLDYGDLVLHIFDEENRLFYDLERIWRDGTAVDTENFR